MTNLTFQPRGRALNAPAGGGRARSRADSGRTRAGAHGSSRLWELDPRLMTRLVSTADGWALVAHSGEAVFRAEGPDARRQCLLRAYALGVQCMR